MNKTWKHSKEILYLTPSLELGIYRKGDEARAESLVKDYVEAIEKHGKEIADQELNQKIQEILEKE